MTPEEAVEKFATLLLNRMTEDAFTMTINGVKADLCTVDYLADVVTETFDQLTEELNK